MSAPAFAECWNFLSAELVARSLKFVDELSAAYQSLQHILEAQAELLRQEPETWDGRRDLPSVAELLDARGIRLLVDPVTEYRNFRPYERALAASGDLEAGLEDVVWKLPDSVAISGKDLAAALGNEARAPLRARWLQWQSKPRPLALRNLALAHLAADSAMRTRLEGDYFLLLAQGALALIEPWQTLRMHALRSLAGGPYDADAAAAAHTRWQELLEVYQKRAERILRDLKLWAAGAPGRAGAAFLRGFGKRTIKAPRSAIHRRQDCFSYWSRQQRAVKALLELEQDAIQLESRMVDAANDSLASTDMEQQDLLSELDEVLQWLGEWTPETAAPEFPPPKGRLLSAEDRSNEWLRRVRGAAGEILPNYVESVEPTRPGPSGRKPWRRLEPKKAFLNALAKAGEAPAHNGFHEAEAGHRAIVREIERAREVVTFGLETAGREGAEGLRIAQESVANAMSLLQHQKQTAGDPHALVEQGLTESIASTAFLYHFALEQGRLGLLTHVLRRSGSQAARDLWELSLSRVAESARWSWGILSRGYHGALVRIGWETPPVTAAAPVVERGYAGDVVRLKLGARDLPMIYQRLFRLAPVEDPRFLVGREAEMAALAEARRRWDGGRSVAVVIVGARGSGKTSLLNCAQADLLRDAPVIRSQFCERITDAGHLRAFLADLIGAGQPERLESEFASGRRVIVLEEVERTFLRAMNGFDGIRELLTMIGATGHSTLWILTLNQHSYQFLERAIGMGDYFSHRINAMAVAPEHLQSAILLRHNLSGLRLQYPPPPKSDPRVSQVRKLLGLQRSAEELFFESLYRQSDGIFRSAFELWQEHMERVEGGVLFMREPVEPRYDALIAQFTLEDAFSLKAILQHGSLTEQEHSAIFECPVEESRNRLARLRSLEILEPEPYGPGLRVRPEAGRLLHTALHRLNLA